jgi:FdrA protein
MPLAWTVQRSSYFDSIALMRVAGEARNVPGVTEVAVVMGTPANRSMLADAGLWPADAPDAGPADLLVTVRASTDDAARAALGRVAELLSVPPREAPSPGDEPAPRTVVSAARRAVAANLAVITVPGGYAAIDAQQALAAGLHVFLFSDGVSLEDEVRLKRRARGRGLIVMGPECGTAIVNGIGLGFANRVRRGPIGVVGASGTGVQEITSLVHRLGSGVSHALGTGGRDLHDRVGGIATIQALERLAGDDSTTVMVIVSKPASAAVADAVLSVAMKAGKPVVTCLLGYTGAAPSGIRAVATLEAAAIAAVQLAGGSVVGLDRPAPDRRRNARVPSGPAQGTIRGLYTGGTLCDEARRLVGGVAHRFIDFGAEGYTRGRPHPIIDPARRQAAIVEAADDPTVSVLLLDVVLGDCAHPDPAGALAPVLAEAGARARRGQRGLTVVAHVVGTDDDPQCLSRQEARLRDVGAIVCPSNRVAAETARDLVRANDA